MKQVTLGRKMLVVAALGVASLARAQDAEAPLQTVQVAGVRDPAMMAYDKAYDLLSKVNKVSKGRVHMAIRVLSAHTLAPIPDLEISLQGEHTSEKLALSPGGFLTVPLNPEALADQASFLSNKRKGSLRVEYIIVPKLPVEYLRYGDIVESIAAARRARAELMPWVLRVFLPSITELGICFPDNMQQVSISHGELASRPAATELKSMLTKDTVYCAHFSADESAISKDSLITAPPGWSALFR